MAEPKRSSRTRITSTAPKPAAKADDASPAAESKPDGTDAAAPTEAAAAVAPEASAPDPAPTQPAATPAPEPAVPTAEPAPAATGATAAAAATPPSTSEAPPPAPAAPTGPPPPNIVDNVGKALRSGVARLSQGELLIVIGTGVVLLIAFVLFGLITNSLSVSNTIVLASLALLLVVWLQVSGRHDFGGSYRLFTAGLALILVVLVAVPLLYQVRSGFAGLDALDWLGNIALWAGTAIAGVGGWLMWANRR
jgi:hypothetical protein